MFECSTAKFGDARQVCVEGMQHAEGENEHLITHQPLNSPGQEDEGGEWKRGPSGGLTIL